MLHIRPSTISRTPSAALPARQSHPIARRIRTSQTFHDNPLRLLKSFPFRLNPVVELLLQGTPVIAYSARDHINTARPTVTKDDPSLQRLLAYKDRDAMSRALETLANRYPEVARDLHQDALIAEGDTESLVASLRSEITDVMTASGWYDSWRGIGSPPDLANVERGLRSLLEFSRPDTVIDLCLLLWSYREGPLNNCQDEGETATAIGECFGIAIEALPQSKLGPAEQLLWEIDRKLEDDYGVMLAAPALSGIAHFSQAHWKEVADHLIERLAASRQPHIRDYITRSSRTQVLDATLLALRNAGLFERVIPLLESEADACQCYTQLVSMLVEAGRVEDARRWCRDGYNRTIVHNPAIATALQQRLRQMESVSG